MRTATLTGAKFANETFEFSDCEDMSGPTWDPIQRTIADEMGDGILVSIRRIDADRCYTAPGAYTVMFRTYADGTDYEIHVELQEDV